MDTVLSLHFYIFGSPSPLVQEFYKLLKLSKLIKIVREINLNKLEEKRKRHPQG